MNKAIIAMSGGVDSSVAAALCAEQGLLCAGLTLVLFKGESGCCSLTNVNDARDIASKLDMEHFVLNLTEEFDKHVVRHFVECYEQGLTPNPCIECNRHIKFNFHLLQACQPEFDQYVTGHYARIKHDPASGRFLLQKAIDEKKTRATCCTTLLSSSSKKCVFRWENFPKTRYEK
ncbi:MAG: hypothetical protein LBC80_08860 [Treponema sp.]|jgi:tRNA-specific 2-thiouridylase|nr:hypothetical protein [Treponema sp.]